ncbi:YhbD family protein [Bacillus vallismortis]|uniref:YhbD family protein n=1 Tax=Bacillus vallismortis TaxID=72361 RepID=A0AAP3CFL7_BACVA|nr:YhbD family protein [Bacillus vallismortis]MCI4136108.1 YhbD family protein [Bacillus vallismortis]MCY7918477.1 YhbD family protein [Bacillus vallismortis]MCY8315641.1 YhbD family protein [Bacillus vallismortis]MCY8425409.1 YhbD family protein [Bacillus vallismortis]MCY8532480.1 YhbD family protein [Bacillus vallismortis]
MEEQLISKKELLEITSISYGQLYRWKRKNLIPEDWFIRKSTFTGQETFFPREDILQRISMIQKMKGNLSLDEMREMLSPKINDISMTADELLHKGLISKPVLEVFSESREGMVFSSRELLSLYVLEGLLQSGNVSLAEAKMAAEVLKQHDTEEIKKQTELIVLRKLGVTTCFIAAAADSILFESSVKVVERVDLAKASEELKTTYMQEGHQWM